MMFLAAVALGRHAVDAKGSTTGPSTTEKERILALGRLVELGSFAAAETLSSMPPDWEITAGELDRGIMLLDDGGWGHVAAFRLSSGAAAWTTTLRAPCQNPVVGGPHLYVICGGLLVAYQASDGASEVIDRAPVDETMLLGQELIYRLKRGGRVVAIDVRTNRRLATKQLPELAGARWAGMVAVSAVAGFCVHGLEIAPRQPEGWRYRLACYDQHFARLWSRNVSFAAAPDRFGDVLGATPELERQEGPNFFVANDQFTRLAEAHGLVVRWRDGQVEPFRDGTFATWDDVQGERIREPTALQAFRTPFDPQIRDVDFAYDQAKIVTSGARAFALIALRQTTGVVALDRASGKVLFRRSLLLGPATWSVELAGGFPVVRTELEHEWRAMILDPSSGRFLYEDHRPKR